MATPSAVAPSTGVPTTNIITPEKEGWLKKRGARMHRWSNRYFALIGPSLTYKLKQDSPTLRGAFDLVPGCILTEVEEDKGSKKGKKFYSFWIVWPEVDEKKAEGQDDQDSDGEEEKEEQVPAKTKDLKQIVQSEVMNNRDKQRRAEEQLEKHHAIDNNLSIGMKVAAVAVGGVVVGALTMGIGLVPYIAVVGAAAVASGGAVAYQYRRPSDSRLILGSENSQEAVAWKAAIEEQILKLEANRRPMLPATADPDVISRILGNSSVGCGWTKVGLVEGMRIMQQTDFNNERNFTEDMLMAISGSPPPPTGRLCRKTQILVPCSPINTFLALMELTWPTPQSSIRIVQQVDDHVDILGVCAPLPQDPSSACSWLESKRFLVGALTRFWFLDDDGSYMITLSPTATPEFPFAEDRLPYKGLKELPLSLDAVFTVSPHKNQDLFDDDLRQALVTCTVQINTKDNTWRNVCEGTRNEFLNSFVVQLLDLRDRIFLSKFELEGEKFLANRPAPVGTVKPSGSLSPNSAMASGRKQPQSQRSTSGEAHAGGVTTSQPVDYSKGKKEVTESGSGSGKKSAHLVMASNHGGVISRSPEVNAEVHSVRNQIRTKQFELERLQQASGSFVSSQSTPAKNTIPTAKQISELKDDIKKLQSRLDRLIGASSGGERYPSSSEASRRSRMSEYAESRESRESLVTRVHVPTTPAARSVQSYQSPLLSSSQKKRIDLPEDTTKRDESIVPCPPHWLQSHRTPLASWADIRETVSLILVSILALAISVVLTPGNGGWMSWIFRNS